jgi:LPS-assembly lipoprotein
MPANLFSPCAMRLHNLRSAGRVLFVIVLLSMSSCGWRLQGATRLPELLASAYIDTKDPYTDFNRALRDSLTSSGAKLVTDRAQATAVVRIRRDVSGQRVLSVSARNTPEEYQVYYAIEYSVDGGGQELIPPDTLEMTRDYSYDETAVLAKQREQALLREALARDLAGLIVRRLAAL